jgi:hypothetical protein
MKQDARKNSRRRKYQKRRLAMKKYEAEKKQRSDRVTEKTGQSTSGSAY